MFQQVFYHKDPPPQTCRFIIACRASHTVNLHRKRGEIYTRTKTFLILSRVLGAQIVVFIVLQSYLWQAVTQLSPSEVRSCSCADRLLLVHLYPSLAQQSSSALTYITFRDRLPCTAAKLITDRSKNSWIIRKEIHT